MKPRYFLHAFAWFFLILVAGVADAYNIRETKSGEEVGVYVAPSGTVTKALSIDGTSLALKATNGTAASPIFSFISDPDTGVYWVGANTFGIAAGGLPVYEVTSGAQATLSRVAGSPAMIVRRANGSGTTAVADNDSLGGYYFQGYDGNSYENAAVIEGQVDGAVADGDMNGRIVFKTTPTGSTSPVEAMRIKSTGATSFKGTVAADNATAGWVGEELRSYTPSGSACDITPGDPTCNTSSLSITAGDFDVTCICALNLNGATVSGGSNCQLTTTSDTLSGGTAFGDSRISTSAVPSSSQDLMVIVPSYRVNQSSTVTWYCVGNTGVSAGTVKGYGRISARRVR